MFSIRRKNSERLLNIKPFMNKYNWEKINYLSKINDSKKFKKLIQELLSIFCILEKKVLPAYISNHNSTHEKTIIILMIPDKDIMALFCSKKKKKKAYILKMNNIKTSIGFLLFELSSLF